MSAYSTFVCIVAATCSVSQVAISQPPERALDQIALAHIERKDQKDANEEREAEINEMARVALLKARHLSIQAVAP